MINAKLVLLGEAAVGKSSIVLQFVSNEFHENKEPTIGAAFLTQKLQIENNQIKFEIWDTAGQERFHSLAPMYYRNAQAAIIVFDITSQISFFKAKKWVDELKRQSDKIVIAIVGNKLDLQNERQVDLQSLIQLASETDSLYFESSAKLNQGIQIIFEKIGQKIVQEGLFNAPPSNIIEIVQDDDNKYCSCYKPHTHP